MNSARSGGAASPTHVSFVAWTCCYSSLGRGADIRTPASAHLSSVRWAANRFALRLLGERGVGGRVGNQEGADRLRHRVIDTVISAEPGYLSEGRVAIGAGISG